MSATVLVSSRTPRGNHPVMFPRFGQTSISNRITRLARNRQNVISTLQINLSGDIRDPTERLAVNQLQPAGAPENDRNHQGERAENRPTRLRRKVLPRASAGVRLIGPSRCSRAILASLA